MHEDKIKEFLSGSITEQDCNMFMIKQGVSPNTFNSKGLAQFTVRLPVGTFALLEVMRLQKARVSQVELHKPRVLFINEILGQYVKNYATAARIDISDSLLFRK